jgi:hypothetical protein
MDALASRVIQRATFEQYLDRLESVGTTYDERVTVATPAAVIKRLKDGQEATAYTRQKLGSGAGNLMDQVTKTGSTSYAFAGYVYQMADQYQKTGSIGFSEAWALAAIRGSSGNCDMFAAVAYHYLLKKNTGDNINIVSLPSVKHHFVLITDTTDPDPTHPDGDTAVVVDAWPAKGYSVKFAHWTYAKETLKVTLGPTTSTGQDLLATAETQLNQKDLNVKAFDKGMTEYFDAYKTGAELRKQVEERVKHGSYFYGNTHNLSDKNEARLEDWHGKYEAWKTTNEKLRRFGLL